MLIKMISLGSTKDELGPVSTIISGGVAGVTLWTVIFPADVIKSRQQVKTITNVRKRNQFLIIFFTSSHNIDEISFKLNRLQACPHL